MMGIFDEPSEVRSPMKVVNLHEYRTLHDAKTAIVATLLNSYHSDVIGVEFIHGHNGGTAQRSYLRSNNLAKDLRKDGFNAPLRVVEIDKGRTSIYFT